MPRRRRSNPEVETLAEQQAMVAVETRAENQAIIAAHEVMGEVLPAGTRVERKSTTGRYGRKRRVPNGLRGRVTGNTKFILARGAQRQAVEVEWDEPCHVHGGRQSALWYSLPEHLIPLEENT